MQNSLILGRDFMKLAKLSLKNKYEVISEIMNIEIDKSDFQVTLDDMRINEDLLSEVKARARSLFKLRYNCAETSENRDRTYTRTCSYEQ